MHFDCVEPIEVGIDKHTLLEMDKAIPKQFNTLNGIIVLRYDKVVLERYYNGYGECKMKCVSS